MSLYISALKKAFETVAPAHQAASASQPSFLSRHWLASSIAAAEVIRKLDPKKSWVGSFFDGVAVEHVLKGNAGFLSKLWLARDGSKIAENAVDRLDGRTGGGHSNIVTRTAEGGLHDVAGIGGFIAGYHEVSKWNETNKRSHPQSRTMG